jgi:putative two-component system response regulator
MSIINGHDRAPEEVTCILVADDDEATRQLLASILGRNGYFLVQARDGEEALAAAYAHHPNLILTDIQMPRVTGIELTRRLRADLSMATVPIILVSGLHETTDKVAGLEAGATDFVTKPFDRAELWARVRAALRTQAAFRRLESVQSILAALANAVEAKDPNTQHHCSRMAALAIELGRSAGLGMAVLEAIGYGAVLHDVGKIGVPERVLLKPGPLDQEDWAHMRQHPGIGATIVEPLQLGRQVAPIVRGHHERWDGGGYPDGLRGEQIPLGARIVAVVDAYDAITQERPYRPARSMDEAREEILSGAGSQFDPELARTFIDSLDARPSPARPGDDAFVRGLTAEIG